ncbi:MULTISPECIES: hypothetical protein [unclassified Agrobacterium]|uniref:hypothetical protein n=1 Tax=unclassified Agrobacterium TaxID=2632611 RepID=UPI00244B51D5|nr:MULTISPECIES: hypothetical protein [unclassified Agrobacterium]MDH0615166.1 hypothetical protein [Agrobacterium sp. GD03872]MDH0698213.1 hypothetical protein [Agrobacterium sp. GD03871]MDH1060239.1 hypothetical protein [Agrobacterium sp. GD03992]MDH2211995.1 hypothetical protein [Agrobacterium sp. GD03643]MDH2220292.1 hypothetical protein [Agrobacterium sp. GD03638]
MFNTFEKIEASISAIRAFNDLMTAAVLQGDDMSLIASGTFRLLDTQVEILADASGEVRNAFNSLEKRERELSGNFAHDSRSNKINNLEFSAEFAPIVKAAGEAIPGADYYRENQLLIARLNASGKTAEEISVLTGLARERVRIFIDAMPDHVVEEAQVSDPMALRREIIAQKIAEGYDAGELAQACNLKRSTVEKVMAKLLGNETVQSPRRAKNG